MPTRTTVYLDEELLARARQFLDSRGLSKWINELIRERVAQLERTALEERLREAYLAKNHDDLDDTTEWAHLELEGWPD